MFLPLLCQNPLDRDFLTNGDRCTSDGRTCHYFSKYISGFITQGSITSERFVFETSNQNALEVLENIYFRCGDRRAHIFSDLKIISHMKCICLYRWNTNNSPIVLGY